MVPLELELVDVLVPLALEDEVLDACELDDELWLLVLWPVDPAPAVVPLPVVLLALLLVLLVPEPVVPTAPWLPVVEMAPWLDACDPDVDDEDGSAVSVGPQATSAPGPIATANDNNEVRRQFN